MRFLISKFLTLTFVTVCMAQAPLEAVKVDSLGITTNEHVQALLDSFISEISQRGKGTRSIIVNYGTPREIESRKRLISSHFRLRSFDMSPITFVRGGNVSELRTDLWIVPAGASSPQIKPEAFVAGEFGRVSRSRARRTISRFLVELENEPRNRGFIVVYGTSAQMMMQEKWFLSEGYFRHRNYEARITFVRGRKRQNGIGTVMWLVPPGAPNPTP